VPWQAPVDGSVRQIEKVKGSEALPLSTDAVIVSAPPTLLTPTANTPVPFTGTTTKPGSLGVVAIATMSAVDAAEADSRSVFTPSTECAGMVLVPLKLNSTIVGVITALGVRLSTKVWAWPPAMSTGLFGVPVGAFVFGSVVWNVSAPARAWLCLRLQRGYSAAEVGGGGQGEGRTRWGSAGGRAFKFSS
jgi:hypothetical protein